jgi:hypothetical protein
MQRGRKSSAELSVIPVAANREWLPPPADLTPSEQSLWRNLVASCPNGQFVQSDFPLLTSYVQATLLARSFAKTRTLTAADAQVLKAAMQMQAAMAAKLRLTPNSRIGPKLAGRKAAAHRPSFYEQMDLEDANNESHG